MTPKPQLDLFESMPAISIHKDGVHYADKYHNTLNLKGKELKEREMRVDAQGRKILDYFRQHSYQRFTPYDVMRSLNYGPFQLQSVRRAMTNLTYCTQHYLIMTGDKKREVCGDFNNLWTLNHNVDQTGYTLTLLEKQKIFTPDAVNKQ